MRIIDAETTRANLPFDALIPALRRMFVEGCESPVRHHHDIHGVGERDATLLLMPAWRARGYLGIKIVSVFPDNARMGKPALASSYLLCDCSNGEHLAMIDGDQITARRTAAASALAASYLARADARHLLVVGAGRIGRLLPEAYRSVRDIARVTVWSRTGDRARRLVEELGAAGLAAQVATDLRAAVTEADIVSCATLSRETVVPGEWLQPGTHLDLIGSFRPDMRETDDAAVSASRVFVDTLTALEESGDLRGPLERGVISPLSVESDLAGLCSGNVPGRRDANDITLFKSTGVALEDLAAAMLVYSRLSAP